MPSRSVTIDPESLLEKLQTYAASGRQIVGFSGGADSTALLVALDELREEAKLTLSALHFNHGLEPQADSWQEHCEVFCKAREIPIESVQLGLEAGADNLEARARELRYRHVETVLRPGDVYLTAHHSGDQAETFFLHALRGSGLDGLAGIPEIRHLGAGQVARPLLDVTREAIEQFLEERAIEWIDDSSNQRRRFDRNFLRHEVLPLVETRWPAARSGLAQSAQLAGQARDALNELLVDDLGPDSLEAESVSAATLLSHGARRAALLLRAWLRLKNVPAPPRARLEAFVVQLSQASSESECQTTWSDWSLKYFGGSVHLLPPDTAGPCPTVEWETGQSIVLAPGTGRLQLSGSGATPPQGWTVAPRRPGSRMRLDEAGPSRTLKNLFRETAIPPWQRASVPVLYWDRTPVAIGDWMLSSRLREWLEKRSLKFEWLPEDRQLKRLQAVCKQSRLTGDNH